jgi:hypothetical protein
VKTFNSEKAALGLGQRVLGGLNVKFIAERDGDKFKTVALLRSDQNWMIRHLKEKGIEARVE